MGVISVILGAIGGFSLINYIVIVITAGFTIAFSEFWLIVGVACLIMSKIFKKIASGEIKGNKKMGVILAVLFGVGLSLFAYVEGKILLSGYKETPANADFVIVLGAQVKGNVPSHSLSLRIEGAEKYLKKNTASLAIASGGKGKGENLSEAAVIKDGLVSAGIEEERIILEDKSTSTVENIKFSMDNINNKEAQVVIITNKFHVMRACLIAKKQGLENVSGLPVKSNPLLALNCYVREFFAVVKDKLVGNI